MICLVLLGWFLECCLVCFCDGCGYRGLLVIVFVCEGFLVFLC